MPKCIAYLVQGKRENSQCSRSARRGPDGLFLCSNHRKMKSEKRYFKLPDAAIIPSGDVNLSEKPRDESGCPKLPVVDDRSVSCKQKKSIAPMPESSSTLLRSSEAERSSGTDSIVEFTQDDIAPAIDDSNFNITDCTYRPEPMGGKGVDTIKPLLLEVPKKLYHETEMVSPALKELARRERVQKNK